MKPSITIATAVKNETDRFLPECLQVWSRFADQIVILDDGSDDHAALMKCVRKNADVHVLVEKVDLGLYGNKSALRRRLWDVARAESRLGDWIMVLDADMIPADDPSPYLRGDRTAFRLHDMWSETHFRTDPWWTAHHRWRTWAVKLKTKPGIWAGEDAHSPHFPIDYAEGQATGCPVPLLHYAYSTPEARQRQMDKYRARWDLLTGPEQAHAETILHDDPHLEHIGPVKWQLQV